MYITHDKFARRAKKEGYRARSAYKLLDIQQKFRVINAGDFVVDLGAAPGSWMQVVSKIVGVGGKVLGIDKTGVSALGLENTSVLTRDIFDEELISYIFRHLGRKADVLLSDAAPATTGLVGRDQAMSFELAKRAFEIAAQTLKKDGNAVVKIFESEHAAELLTEVKKRFGSVHMVKPRGSQKTSKEVYIVARFFL